MVHKIKRFMFCTCYWQLHHSVLDAHYRGLSSLVGNKVIPHNVNNLFKPYNTEKCTKIPTLSLTCTDAFV